MHLFDEGRLHTQRHTHQKYYLVDKFRIQFENDNCKNNDSSSDSNSDSNSSSGDDDTTDDQIQLIALPLNHAVGSLSRLAQGMDIVRTPSRSSGLNNKSKRTKMIGKEDEEMKKIIGMK